MKKPSSKIREEILKLQEQLKAAETREAERIGRIALKAGLGDIEIDEGALLEALEQIAGKFRRKTKEATGRMDEKATGPAIAAGAAVAPDEAVAVANGAGEA